MASTQRESQPARPGSCQVIRLWKAEEKKKITEAAESTVERKKKLDFALDFSSFLFISLRCYYITGFSISLDIYFSSSCSFSPFSFSLSLSAIPDFYDGLNSLYIHSCLACFLFLSLFCWSSSLLLSLCVSVRVRQGWSFVPVLSIGMDGKIEKTTTSAAERQPVPLFEKRDEGAGRQE